MAVHYKLFPATVFGHYKKACQLNKGRDSVHVNLFRSSSIESMMLFRRRTVTSNCFRSLASRDLCASVFLCSAVQQKVFAKKCNGLQ